MDDAGERDPIPSPSKDRRWDIDERGHGVADARRLAPRIGELARAVEVEDWIAEQPEMHLWPHLERAIEAVGSPWMSGAFTIDDDGTLVVELVHATVDGDRVRARRSTPMPSSSSGSCWRGRATWRSTSAVRRTRS